MALFRCTNCNYEKITDDKYLGKKAACPKCKTASLFVADEIEEDKPKPLDFVPITPTGAPAMSYPAPPLADKGNAADHKDHDSGWCTFLTMLAVLIFVAAILMLTVEFKPRWEHAHSFKTDNTDGATANATEFIAKRMVGLRTMILFLFGMLVCVLISLYRLRQAVLRVLKVLESHYSHGEALPVRVPIDHLLVLPILVSLAPLLVCILQ